MFRKNIKKKLKKLLPPIWWQYLYNLRHNKLLYLNNLRLRIFKYKSLDNLDKKIESYLNFNNGYFVELGANDGITYSNTYYFEKYRGWKGILIEPIPHKYLNCLKIRSKETQVFCNACVSYDFDEKFIEIIYSNLMSTPIGLETDIDNLENHAKEGKKYLENSEDNFNFAAIAEKLNNILLKANAPKK